MMKNAFHWKRVAFLAAALAVAGQAHASGGQSGVGGNGTGGPQNVRPDTGSTEPPSVSPSGTDGVPLWYSVNGVTRSQPPSGAWAGAPSVMPRGTDGVPTWYSVNGINGRQPPREPTAVAEQSRPVPLPRWYAIQ